MREETMISVPVVNARHRRLHPRLTVAAVLLAGALAGVSFWACTAGRPGAVGQQHLGQAESDVIKVTVKGRDADVTEILRSVAKQADARLNVSPAIHGTMSIEAKDAQLDGLMNDLCTAFSCEWKLAMGTPRSLIVLPATAPSPVEAPLPPVASRSDGP